MENTHVWLLRLHLEALTYDSRAENNNSDATVNSTFLYSLVNELNDRRVDRATQKRQTTLLQITLWN